MQTMLFLFRCIVPVLDTLLSRKRTQMTFDLKCRALVVEKESVDCVRAGVSFLIVYKY